MIIGQFSFPGPLSIRFFSHSSSVFSFGCVSFRGVLEAFLRLSPVIGVTFFRDFSMFAAPTVVRNREQFQNPETALRSRGWKMFSNLECFTDKQWPSNHVIGLIFLFLNFVISKQRSLFEALGRHSRIRKTIRLNESLKTMLFLSKHRCCARSPHRTRRALKFARSLSRRALFKLD